MNETLLNIVLIFVFVLIGGVFAAAEMALVSLRESQIKSIAHRGKRGETVARVAANPNRFLSAVQIGVTLMGFLSAAFGGATLADGLSPHLQKLGLPESRGEHGRAGPDHHRHLVRLDRDRRAGGQAARAAAGRARSRSAWRRWWTGSPPSSGR